MEPSIGESLYVRNDGDAGSRSKAEAIELVGAVGKGTPFLNKCSKEEQNNNTRELKITYRNTTSDSGVNNTDTNGKNQDEPDGVSRSDDVFGSKKRTGSVEYKRGCSIYGPSDGNPPSKKGKFDPPECSSVCNVNRDKHLIKKRGAGEKELLRKFKTLGDRSHKAYAELAGRRVVNNNFEFYEIKHCLESLKGYVKEYEEKEDASDAEKEVFCTAIKDIDQLVAKNVPYIQALDLISRVISTFDFYLFRRKIRPFLGKGNITMDRTKSTVINLFLQNNKKKYGFGGCGSCSFDGVNKLQIHADTETDRVSAGFFFTCYPDSVSMKDVYNDLENVLKVNRGVCGNESLIILPTTVPVGFKSYARILRFPIWLAAVCKGPAVVDGNVTMPYRNYCHDFIHASYNKRFPNVDKWYFSNGLSLQWCLNVESEGNPFVQYGSEVEYLYVDFDKRINPLKEKGLKEVFYMLLFYLLHEIHSGILSFKLLYCDEDIIKKAVIRLKENICKCPNVPIDWADRIDAACEIFKSSKNAVRKEFELPAIGPLSK